MKSLTFVLSVGLACCGSSAMAQSTTPGTAAVTPATPTTASISTSLQRVVFPAKGQSAQKQSEEEGACYAWAKGQTGVDPMAPPPPATAQAPATPAAPEHAGGTRVRGAARGAAAGAIIGEIADDDAGKGAAIGAAAGVLRGGAEARREQREAAEKAAESAEQAAAQQQAASQEHVDLFKKGFAACLEAKGYTVK